MKERCKCALRDYMTMTFLKARHDEQLTQAQFAELLMLDTRSYADLEHGESLCCTLTFIIYLVSFCKEPETLIRDLRTILLKPSGDDPFVL